jgi:hypothetical protein
MNLKTICWEKITLLFALSLTMTMNTKAYEKAFEPTPPGKVEIKTIPALTAIVNQGDGEDYFEENGDLFMPLFRYIQERDIAMTTPVESTMKPASMSFYIGSDAKGAPLEPDGPVKVTRLPERTVLAIGISGSYSRKNYEKALNQAREWLKGQSDYEATGEEARMIYWDAPFVPWFLKKSELHLDVRKTS